jgi:Tol biopolymer transport system component
VSAPRSSISKGKVIPVFELLPTKRSNLVCTIWSPGDRRLACEGWDDSHPTRAGIYMVRSTDGKDLKRVTSTPVGQEDAAGSYSPDGKDIVLERTMGEGGPLMVVPADGGKPRQISDQVVNDPGRYSFTRWKVRVDLV